MDTRHLQRMGDLGVAVPLPFSPRDEDSIRRATENSDIVINLIGKDYETSSLPWGVNCSYEEAHVDVAGKVARIAVEQGVSTLVHVSALAADEHSLSRWARSKALGEAAVRAEAPGATIVRPADVFGPRDRLLSLFSFMNKALPRVPLVDGGHARLQPLFVQDLAYALERIALSTQPDIALGQTYDLAPSVMNISPTVADVIGKVVGVWPEPPLCADRMTRMGIDNVLNVAAPTKRLADLGIEATSMELPGLQFLSVEKHGDHFLEMETEETIQFRERA
ncbi:Ndufa9 [Symbiodinium sp. KB8]|nr:Ndufa9 [Symbiodinium sp. KB8]